MTISNYDKIARKIAMLFRREMEDSIEMYRNYGNGVLKEYNMFVAFLMPIWQRELEENRKTLRGCYDNYYGCKLELRRPELTLSSVKMFCNICIGHRLNIKDLSTNQRRLKKLIRGSRREGFYEC